MADILWLRDLLTSSKVGVTMAEIMWVRQLLTSSRVDDGLDLVSEAIADLQ
jgi:hypothetical protein